LVGALRASALRCLTDIVRLARPARACDQAARHRVAFKVWAALGGAVSAATCAPHAAPTRGQAAAV